MTRALIWPDLEAIHKKELPRHMLVTMGHLMHVCFSSGIGLAGSLDQSELAGFRKFKKWGNYVIEAGNVNSRWPKGQILVCKSFQNPGTWITVCWSWFHREVFGDPGSVWTPSRAGTCTKFCRSCSTWCAKSMPNSNTTVANDNYVLAGRSYPIIKQDPGSKGMLNGPIIGVSGGYQIWALAQILTGPLEWTRHPLLSLLRSLDTC